MRMMYKHKSMDWCLEERQRLMALEETYRNFLMYVGVYLVQGDSLHEETNSQVGLFDTVDIQDT